ncbi:MAG: VTC domain-containing protein [Nitriliruptoraceae bacterium]
MTAGPDALASLAAVGLDAVTAAGAQARYDRKYLVDVAGVDIAIAALHPRFGALQIGTARAFDYVTVYFDTPDLATFRMHRQGRRRRFKIRTRHYGNPDTVTLEVKCKSARGQTVKYRRAHTGSSAFALDDAGRQFVHTSLERHYGAAAYDFGLSTLDWTVETTFTRSTLVAETLGERVTIDRHLAVRGPASAFTFDPARAIVETKSPRWYAVSGRALRDAGAREGRLSKYCLGIAVLHPHVAANPWRRSVHEMAGGGRSLTATHA